MKKRILALFLCAALAFGAVGCGDGAADTADGTETVPDTGEASAASVNLAQYDLKGSDYVTLCDYSAIPVTLDGDYDVTDDDVDDYVRQIFEYNGPFYAADETKTTVAEGDIVNVDYVGKLDGEAFDGGTAEDQNIDVTNNSSADGTSSYIDGFSEGLMGASVGDVIDCDVTFPDDYSSSDLAGKAVVFTFTVNSIQREIAFEEMDDAFVSEQFGVDTVDEFYSTVREYMETSTESDYENDVYTAVEDYLLENCTVTMPEDYVSDVLLAIHNNFVENYCDGDESQMETVAESYGYELADLEQQWQESVESSIKLELIVKAIAEAEGITVEDADFQEYVDNILSSAGYSDTETFYSQYGYGDVEYGEAQIRLIYLAGLVLEEVSDTAVVTTGTEAVENTESTETAE